MSISSLPVTALMVLLGTATAAEPWIVPPTPEPVPIRGTGFIEAHPDRLVIVTTDAVRSRIKWLGVDGRIVAPGDVLVELSTDRIAVQVEERRRQSVEADAQFTLEGLRLASELRELEDEREDLRVRLATVRAQLAALGSDDALAATLARATATEAAADAEAAQRQAAYSAQLAVLGDIATEEARSTARQAERSLVTAQRSALEANALPQREAALERLQIEERDVLARLGCGVDGTEDPKRGIGGRIAAATGRAEGQRKNGTGERDARRRELHEAERDVADHTPVAWIDVVRDGTTIARYDQVAPGQTPAPGWTADSGETYTPERGFGWNQTHVPLPGHATGEAAPGVVLVGREATWSADLSDGPCTVRLGLGDALDWNGATVRFPDDTGWTQNRLPAGILVVEHPSTIRNGRLDLRFGDGRGKALRAEKSAMVLLVPNMPLGNRIDNKTRPVVWCVEPTAMRVNVRLPQDLAALLVPAATADKRTIPRDPAGRVRHAMAVTALDFTTSDGKAGSATITEVVDKPVDARRTSWGWADSSSDDLRGLIWREIHLGPTADITLRPRTEVLVTGQALVPPGTAVLPAHLVSPRPDGFLVQEFGQAPRRVPALRAGERWIVLEGVSPGQRLIPPVGNAVIDPRTGPFAGEVIAGISTPVVLSRAWGRIKTLVNDGADVAAGDLIATLYNPELEQNRERMVREKSRARQDARIAAENSRTRTISTADARRQRVDAARQARLNLDEARQSDPVSLALAASSAQAAQAEAAWTVGLVDRLTHLTHPDPGQLAKAVAAAQSADLAAQREILEAAVTARALTLDRVLGTEAAWLAADRALDLGDGDDRLARDDNQRARLLARLRLREALRGGWFEREFNLVKDIRAPVAGRVWLKNGWDEGRGRWSRLIVDTTVWQGVALADIVDPLRPAFRAELPEDLYPRLSEGRNVRLAFPHLGGLTLTGTVKQRSPLLDMSRDDRTGDEVRIGAVRRVFTATITFDVPDGLGDAFDPGQTGTVELE